MGKDPAAVLREPGNCPFPALPLPMVANTGEEPFSAFQHPLLIEDGPQSSEEGSGLHSPVFDTQFSPVNDGFRYQSNPLDIRPAPSIHFDYDPTQQQPPLIKLDQPLADFLPQSPVVQSDHQSPVNFAYNLDQRLPYDPSYSPAGIISGISMEGDNIRPVTSSNRAESSANPRPPRKEISTTVIACRQCRARKIRCDSTRPVCNNCVRRSNPCEYDAVPKRRGPDKNPGTRLRSCKKRPTDGSAPPPPKRKRLTANRDTRTTTVQAQKKDTMVEGKRPPMPGRRQSDPPGRGSKGDLRISTTPAVKIEPDRPLYPDQQQPPSFFSPAFANPFDFNIIPFSDQPHPKFPPPSPLVESNQKIWWDDFLLLYSLKEVVSDLHYLFRETGHWLSFLNIPSFMQTLSNPMERLRIQPSFVLAGLAMSNLMRSSEMGFGADGRNKAMWLREWAQRELENAWNSEWIDAGLAEAALILTLFETSVHPQHHPDRVTNAIGFLDNIIRYLGLTSVDSDDHDVSIFNSRSVPVVEVGGSDDFRGRRCSCIPPDSLRPPDHRNSWSYPLPWDSKWTVREIRDEECRRVCWNALGLVTNYSAQYAAFDQEVQPLFLTDPSNYRLLFPGEVLDRVSPAYRASDSQTPKESVWALYCRSLLLWCFCERFRHDPLCPEEDKAEFAQEAWNETQSILDSLNFHVCNLDTALIYMSREYIYNTRMAITQVLRGLQGLDTSGSIFSRKQAEEWIFYQDQVLKRVKHSIQRLSDPTSDDMFTRRPYQARWYSNQLALCLKLWSHDRSLLNVLELAKSFLIPVDVMTVLWPSPYQSQHTAELRKRLTEACSSVGLDPPHPQSYSLPPHLRNHFVV